MGRRAWDLPDALEVEEELDVGGRWMSEWERQRVGREWVTGMSESGRLCDFATCDLHLRPATCDLCDLRRDFVYTLSTCTFHPVSEGSFGDKSWCS